MRVISPIDAVALVFSGTLILACGGSAQQTRSPQPEPEGSPAEERSVAEVLSAEIIKFGLSPGRSDKCFDDTLGERHGKAHLAWRVDASGSVSRVEVLDLEPENDQLASCLSELVGSAQFSSHHSPAKAEWVFVHNVPQSGASKRRRGSRKAGKTYHDEGPSIEADSPGRLEPERIESTVMGAFPVFSHCIREGLERDPTLNGSVRMRFVVDPAGRVVDVRNADSEVAEPSVLDCVAEGFYTLRFPEPRGGPLHAVHVLLLNVD